MLLVIGILMLLSVIIIDEKQYKISVCMFIFGLLVICYTAFVTINKPTELIYRKNIFSLNIFNGFEGNFSLGTGHVGSEPIYYFYTKNNGMYRLETVTGNVQIKFDKDNHYIEYYRQKSDILFPVLNDGHEHYIITIPEDSIISNNFDPNIKQGE